MITIKTETTMDLQDFKAWSGGKQRLDDAIDAGVVKELEQYILMFIDSETGFISDTALNDMLWFGVDDYLNELGVDGYEYE